MKFHHDETLPICCALDESNHRSVLKNKALQAVLNAGISRTHEQALYYFYPSVHASRGLWWIECASCGTKTKPMPSIVAARVRWKRMMAIERKSIQ